MEEVTWRIVAFVVFGSWLAFIPRHMEFILVKYQSFLYKYIPPAQLVFKTEKEASTPIFNERAIRAIGFANYFAAVVVATTHQW
tara:strand:- start:599 stop:850 length:252 start_codon:yes stop_codon:yes gene_type:complete